MAAQPVPTDCCVPTPRDSRFSKMCRSAIIIPRSPPAADEFRPAILPWPIPFATRYLRWVLSRSAASLRSIKRPNYVLNNRMLAPIIVFLGIAQAVLGTTFLNPQVLGEQPQAARSERRWTH
jgi:hypothetical protein